MLSCVRDRSENPFVRNEQKIVADSPTRRDTPKNHQQILNQIWGNDISHFPATLSVISLYKQKVDDTANFPRIIRKDFFTLTPSQTIAIPDNKDIDKINQIPIPKFDAVISNFPFIQ